VDAAECSGDMDGDRLASGDSDGENDGDMATDWLKPGLDSWLIGDRGTSNMGGCAW